MMLLCLLPAIAGTLAMGADAPLSETAPTAAFVLQQREAQRDAIENGYCRALWEQSVDGQLTRWMQAVLHFDDMNRARYYAEHGVYEGTKRVVQKTDCYIYNGEITVHLTLGLPATEGEALNVTHANIYDGPRPGAGPLSLLNPFTATNGLFLSALKSAMERNDPVTIAPVGERPGLYEVIILQPVRQRATHLEYRATVDSTRAWSAIAMETRDHDGRLVQSRTLKYPPAAHSGIWVPLGGSTKQLFGRTLAFHSPHGNDHKVDIPAHEWRFAVTDIDVNDPDFPDDVFDVVLPPGTLVWDSRFKVDYRVGAEALLERDLARAAAAARAAQERHPMANPYSAMYRDAIDPTASEGNGEWATNGATSMGTLRGWLMAANITVLLLGVAVWSMRRLRRTRTLD